MNPCDNEAGAKGEVQGRVWCAGVGCVTSGGCMSTYGICGITLLDDKATSSGSGSNSSASTSTSEKQPTNIPRKQKKNKKNNST